MWFLLLAAAGAQAASRQYPGVPADFLRQPDQIPEFWIGSVDEVNRFLSTGIHKGNVTVLGATAGGQAIRMVAYGTPRQGKGTSTFSGSLGFGDARVYFGPDYGKKVYMTMGGVHGGEFEGIVGIVNLLSVLETGQDLRGRKWPEITEAAKALDRIVLVPIVNLDGRARIPLRMMAHRGKDFFVHEYWNTGGRLDGKLLGWPQVKEFIPLDFTKTQFPGGYPNDAGVNVQHDDFLSSRRQPETQALLELTASERPDLILNMHTGAQFIQPLRPFVEPVLMPTWEALYRQVRTRLALEGLQASSDPAKVADPARERMSPYNLDTALNLNCGALSFVVESPSHNFSTSTREGKSFVHTPDELVTAQLLTHLEAMKFLAQTGGRARWTAKPKK